MKLLTYRYIWVVIFFCLTGCHRFIPGAPAAAPTNVSVVSGDTTGTVTWDMVPGVQYFIFWDSVAGVTPENCGTGIHLACLATINATSPYVISGLTDGTTYSVTINGRTEGAAGGPGIPAISFDPGYAGTSWASGSTGTNTLNGITYGNVFDALGNNLGNGYVAAGASGALYYGIVDTNHALNWTPITNPLPTTTFNALSNTGATFLAVGNGGAILYSANYTETWTPITTTTTPYDLLAISPYNGFFIAVGQNATILTSDATGTIWSIQSSGISNSPNLNGVTLANGYIAVGDAGTLLNSSNAVTWIPNTSVAQISSISSVNLKSVTYCAVIPPSGLYIGTTIYPTVAVGSGGTILTSLDGGTTWTSQSLASAGAGDFTSVTCGHQFVAADASGHIFTSYDGLSWAQQTSPSPTGQINAITHGLYDYSAVGANGLTIYSFQ